jgi:hypothetical protein
MTVRFDELNNIVTWVNISLFFFKSDKVSKSCHARWIT